MPEIPEMEVYRKQLSQIIIPKKIVDITINREKAINISPEAFRELVNEQLIVFVSRRGKHLIFTLGNGYYLLTHLMLQGRIYFAEAGEKIKNKGSIVFHFYDESKLIFINLRLGWLHVVEEREMDERLSKLGVEPLGPLFKLDKFGEILSERRGNIKSLLTNQEFLAGIGNCYSDEILFAAGVRPERKANELNFSEVNRLFLKIPEVLKEAITNGGYMDKPLYKRDNLTGRHSDHLRVYDRAWEPCFQCGNSVKLIKVAGKKSFFCSTCQV